MSKSYTTANGGTYRTTKEFTGVVIANSIVNGALVQSNWKKNMRMVTLNIAGQIQSYFTEEAVNVSVGDSITTHASINENNIRFISMRHIK